MLGKLCMQKSLLTYSAFVSGLEGYIKSPTANCLSKLLILKKIEFVDIWRFFCKNNESHLLVKLKYRYDDNL